MAIPVACFAATNDSESKWGYDTIVDPSTRPAWLEKAILISENPWVNRDKRQLKPWIKILKDAGFNVVNMYPDSFCRLYAPEAGGKWSRECHEEVKAMHEVGLFVLAGCYPTVGERGPRDLLTEHPEWRLRKNGKVPDSPGMGCLISPFGDALIQLLVSRIKEYDIDGFQFDGWYQYEYCCCSGCEQNYKQETGYDVPPKADRADPNYIRYLAWRNERLFRRFEQLQAAVKAVKPGAAMVQWNNNDCAGSYPSGMPESLNCVSDWVNKEWWDVSDATSSWVIRRLRGSSGDRPAGIQPYMFMRRGDDVESGVYHGSSCPMAEVLYRMHKILALGSIPIIWPGARQGWTDADSLAVSRDLVNFLPYVHQTQSLKYAACLDSFTTLQGLRTNSKEEITQRVAWPRGGITRALIETHLPFDVLSEHNLTAQTLAQYKVFILPNNRCVPARIASLINDYVKNGGSLVATFETSLYDSLGKKKSDFDLAALFGASYLSSAPIGPSRIAYSSQKHPVTEDRTMLDLTGTNGLTTYYGQFARVRAASGAIVPLIGVDVNNETDPQLKKWVPLLLSHHGQGRVAYFPAAIDAAYFDAGYPYERMLIANAVRWAAGGEPPVTVTAPMCVQAGYFTQTNGLQRRIIVHLLNEINTTTGHGSINEKECAIREEVVPISGIRVAFSGPRPARVLCVPGNQSLEITQAAQGWSVAIQPLQLHSVVVAVYEP